MVYSLKPIEKLSRELSRLPGMGLKTAKRLAFHFVQMKEESVVNIAEAIKSVQRDISVCPICFSYLLSNDTCQICSDHSRDPEKLCVLEKAQDVFIMERGDFNGKYHILNGLIAPLDGVGPDDIKIKELLARIKKENIKEVIIVLNSSVEGDVTTMYIAQMLNGFGVKISRLARGVPAGANIDYVDDTTLSNAIQERQDVVC